MKTNAKQLAQIYLKEAQGKSPYELQETSRAFIELLRERQELHLFRDIIRHLEPVLVKIDSAYPVSDEMIAKIKQSVGDAEIQTNINPELIGGAKVRINERIIDGTVAKQLEALKQILTANS